MELAETLAIPFEKTINFGKSSGGKQGESHLGKLNTFDEILRKNYPTKCIEEKSFSTFKTITRSEFHRRRSSFENLFWLNDFWGKNSRKTFEVGNLLENEPCCEFSRNAFRETRSLNDITGSGDECKAREKEMTQKLTEIQQIIRQMQDKAEKPLEGRGRKKFFYRRDPKNKAPLATSQPLQFETICKLKRKLIPTRFASSFTTELGSSRKTFVEQIIFQNCFAPDFPQEKGKLFRSTLEIACQPEMIIQIKNALNFN